jgi:hypothetical protein
MGMRQPTSRRMEDTISHDMRIERRWWCNFTQALRDLAFKGS